MTFPITLYILNIIPPKRKCFVVEFLFLLVLDFDYPLAWTRIQYLTQPLHAEALPEFTKILRLAACHIEISRTNAYNSLLWTLLRRSVLVSSHS